MSWHIAQWRFKSRHTLFRNLVDFFNFTFEFVNLFFKDEQKIKEFGQTILMQKSWQFCKPFPQSPAPAMTANVAIVSGSIFVIWKINKKEWNLKTWLYFIASDAMDEQFSWFIRRRHNSCEGVARLKGSIPVTEKVFWRTEQKIKSHKSLCLSCIKLACLYRD